MKGERGENGWANDTIPSLTSNWWLLKFFLRAGKR